MAGVFFCVQGVYKNVALHTVSINYIHGVSNYLHLNSIVTFDPTVYLVCLLVSLDSTAIIDHNTFSAGHIHILNMDCLVKFNNYVNMLISTHCMISSTESFYD